MRRLLLPLVLVLAACGSEAGGPATNLTVTVDDGGGAARELRLECADSTDSPACGAAAGVSEADLAPTPGDTMCTEIYGGPETARITGTLRGEPVDATFSRVNGCEIARWEGVQALLEHVR